MSSSNKQNLKRSMDNNGDNEDANEDDDNWIGNETEIEKDQEDGEFSDDKRQSAFHFAEQQQLDAPELEDTPEIRGAARFNKKAHSDGKKEHYDGKNSTTARWRNMKGLFEKAMEHLASWDARVDPIPMDFEELLKPTPNCICPLCGLKISVWNSLVEASETLGGHLSSSQNIPQPTDELDVVNSNHDDDDDDDDKNDNDEIPCVSTRSALLDINDDNLSDAQRRWVAEMQADNANLRVRNANLRVRYANMRVEKANALAEKANALAEKANVLAKETNLNLVMVVKDTDAALHTKNELLHVLINLFHNDTGFQGSRGCSVPAVSVDESRVDPNDPLSPPDFRALIDNSTVMDPATARTKKKEDSKPVKKRKQTDHDNDHNDDDHEHKKIEAIDFRKRELVIESSISIDKWEQVRPILVDFHSCLEAFFSDGMVPTDGTFPESIQKTLEFLYNWRSYLALLQTNGSRPFRTFVPGQQGHEVVGSHPILIAILFEMAAIVGLDVGVTHERAIVNEEARTVRKVDLLADRIQEYVNAVFAFMYVVPIEIKPLGRERESLEAILKGGTNQIIGHLGRKIHHYFHFGGIGLNRKCRGAVITLVSIEILELELANVGTEKVLVELSRTKRYSLFSLETTRRLLGDKSLPQISFEEDVSGLPKDFLLLVEMLFWPGQENGFRDDEFITYLDEESGDVRRLNVDAASCLGQGSFGVVYKASNSSIVKIPLSFRTVRSLKREAAILRMLDHENIPKVLAEKQIILTTDLVTRCDSTQMHSLWLTGHVGTAASNVVLAAPDVVEVYQAVQAALDHAHARGYIHLDVRPSNIVVLRQAKGPLLVQLIDWGCALNVSEKKKGFRGSPPYAHGEICMKLREDKNERNLIWTARSMHDMASLAYTVAVLSREQIGSVYHVPWHGFHGAKLDDVILESRRNQALVLINSSLLAEDMKTRLRDALTDEKEAVAAVRDAAAAVRDAAAAVRDAAVAVRANETE